MTTGKRLRYRLEVGLLRVTVAILPRLPRSVLVRLARCLGLGAYYLLGKQRRIALANLDVAFGETKSREEKKQIARCSMQQFALTVLGLLWSPRLTTETLDSVLEINPVDLQKTKEMLNEGHGTIFVTLHFGDWELMGLGGGFVGVPAHIVTETLRNAELEKIFTRLRSRSGNTIVAQQGAAIRLLRALRRKQAVALLIDLNAPEQSGGMWLNFFGLPVYNNTAVAALALRTGARIVGVRAVPLRDGRVRLIYGPEIPSEQTGNEQEDVRRISQACLDFCEQVIRENPGYWLWSYKRWKHRLEKPRGRYPFYTTRFNPGMSSGRSVGGPTQPGGVS